jgi:hypothetical protein
MHEDIARIRGLLETSDFVQRSFPVLLNPGVKDEDVFIHSIGCSLWNSLGHELGYSAVVEAPAPTAAGPDIRTDSTWFSKAPWFPKVLIEFERFDSGARGAAKLDAKVANLLEAANRWRDEPRLLILSAWSSGVVNAPNLDRFRGLLRSGVHNALGVHVPGGRECPLLLNRWIFGATPTGLLALRKLTFQEVA